VKEVRPGANSGTRLVIRENVRVSRWIKVGQWTGVVLVAALIAGLITGYWTIRRSFPQTSGNVTVPGLDAAVSVLRDSHGIPQIYAETPHDLFLAQGYVQAQDRFFEMDFRRHLTAGRISELLGEDALEADKFVRASGWRRVAEEELPLLSPDTRHYLEYFSEGVNAYLDERQGSRLSLEYAVFGLGGVEDDPEEWTPLDSLAWLKAMSWNLGSNIDDELERSLDTADLTPEQIAELFPAYPYEENQPIVTQGAIVDGVYEQNATGGGTRLPRRPPPFITGARAALRDARAASEAVSALLGTGDGIGSNAWAVSGDHTASGAPILANDPHLDATIPSVWYQMGLHCNEVDAQCPFDVSGFTFAGFPGVVIGHNADIAWGFSNLYPDTQDLYLEKVSDDNTYLYNGRRRPLKTREETFVIAGRDDPLTITLRESRHGPLISDISDDFATVGANAPAPDDAPDRGNGYAVALRWTALEPGSSADALFGLNLATDWNSFREAARDFVTPAQNMVYADTDGHIGYQAPGDVPIRRTGHGDWPVPGWDPAYEWDDEYIPFDALPSVLDPEDGFVVTANQAIVGEKYPYYIGDSYDLGFRAQRIRELLEDDDSITVDDMSQIQLDDYSALAEEITPKLLKVRLPTAYYQAGQRLLADWDFHEDADSAPAAYFNVFWRQMLALTFHDDLPEDAWPLGGSRWWVVMRDLLEEPRDAFWDDADTAEVRETRDDIIVEAMMQARDELTRIRSRVASQWRWGDLHTLKLRNEHLASEDSPVDFLFARGDYELAGGPSIVNAAWWEATVGYDVTAVPSMRMVIPMDDLDAARWINLTGASGHAYNSHYTDQTDLWAKGETLPWVFSRDEVESATDETLVLEPPR
jgi:penicillin amidase